MTDRDRPLPTRAQAALHGAKIQVHRARRGLWNRWITPSPRWPDTDRPEGWRCVAESRSALRGATDPSERALEAGKIQNLRRAAQAFDGVYVPPGRSLSFWAQVGRPSAGRGFAVGREIRQGCLIPSVGGGLCQLSNALYDAALTAGLPVPERHAHSQVVPGSLAETGRDATVFWNYVDLRVRAPEGLWVSCRLSADHLVVRLHAPAAAPARRAPALHVLRPTPNSCATCGQGACFRNADAVGRRLERPRTAWILDGMWPEFDRLLAAERASADPVLLAVDGRRVGWDRYAWSTQGAPVITAPQHALVRSLRARQLSPQGADRQRALLADDAALARTLGERLPVDCERAVVSARLLPHLWRQGALGGRRFEVLLDRPPLATLQRALDEAAARWPDSPTLSDFRAPAALVRAEGEALAAADRIHTPHPGLAAAFGPRGHGLPWARGRAVAPVPSTEAVVVFPASTLGRHGAWALREALAGRAVRLLRCGPEVEGVGFWGGRAEATPWPEALRQATVVALPGHVPGAPRRLLDAVASGVPVITTPAAGLAVGPGVRVVPAGDVPALAAALDDALAPATSTAWPRCG
ncbi:MAG: VanW family protein [Myxococcales bacterium]|nr:VanW family protein [Myxococcales bacterium]